MVTSCFKPLNFQIWRLLHRWLEHWDTVGTPMKSAGIYSLMTPGLEEFQ